MPRRSWQVPVDGTTRITAMIAATLAHAPVLGKRASSRRPKNTPRHPDHHEIAERAYFIHLQEGDCA